MRPIRIGIIGDFESTRPTHAATNAALQHAAQALSVPIDVQWLSTTPYESEDQVRALEVYDGLWGAPGSPYQSRDGAINAIRFAREHDIPFLGTWGGFQHTLVEYARHVLGLADADHEEYAPATSCLFISQLTCSLVGQTQTIHLTPGSLAHRICRATEIVTEYFCNYGLNPAFREHLERGALAITGIGAEGDVRVVELPHHRFFLATLFLPQWGSTPEHPDPFIVAYLQAAKARVA